MAQIYYDALGRKGALAFVALLFIVQYFMGLSICVTASRQLWAFSRDGGAALLTLHPPNSCIEPMTCLANKGRTPQSARFGHIPLRATWACVLVASVFGLLCLVAPAAASALFSLCIAGDSLAWCVPILARVVWGQARFAPGPFYTGKRWSAPIAWAAAAFLAFAIVLAMFPLDGPRPAPADMNYCVVVNAAVWGGATLYYFLDARKWFKGPGGMREEQGGEGEGVGSLLTDNTEETVVKGVGDVQRDEGPSVGKRG
ncbi:uncharacterized protein PG998_006305 [Apiospora kogelbergensis]|uniref:uncharacterized protein n=1 Tax=Apiospora kogelbergensis TaxID=1337665 RepID=UPI003130428B